MDRAVQTYVNDIPLLTDLKSHLVVVSPLVFDSDGLDDMTVQYDGAKLLFNCCEFEFSPFEVQLKSDTKYSLGKLLNSTVSFRKVDLTSALLLDKHANYMELINTDLLIHFMKRGRFTAVVGLINVTDEYDSDEDDNKLVLEPVITILQFLDYECPQSKMMLQLERIESILEMPNNLASIEGWVKLMESHGFVRGEKSTV